MYITINVHTNPIHKDERREVFQTTFSDPPFFRKVMSIHYKYTAIAVLDSVKGTTSTTPQEQTYRSFQVIYSLLEQVLLVLLNIYLFVRQAYLKRVVVKAMSMAPAAASALLEYVFAFV